MGSNWSIPNPLGFLPEQQLPNPYAPRDQDWDQNKTKDPWPQARNPSPGAWGPGFVPPHGGLQGWSAIATQGLQSSVPGDLLAGFTDQEIEAAQRAAGPGGIAPLLHLPTSSKVIPTGKLSQIRQGLNPPPATTNRKKGRPPTPNTPPARVTHPPSMTWREKYGHLVTSSPTETPAAAPTVSPSSSTVSPTGGPASNMGAMLSGPLAPLLGLQVVSFLWTKILTTAQNLDSWWTSLSFPGGTPECNGHASPSPTFRHLPTSCPPTCGGFRWMCLRRFIIYLWLLVLCLIFLLGLLDSRGLIPVCPYPEAGATTINLRCNQCTASADETSYWPLCCCTKPTGGNCTCYPIPSSWALGRFLWGWASARFSWLNSLLLLLQWLGGISPILWPSLIWMMWFWGPSLLNILMLFTPLLLLFLSLWAYI
ncbi:surface protein [Orthohepadnavirus magnimyotis]|nr:surface protein [Longquan Myotis chinensis orthohepadnavirus 1]